MKIRVSFHITMRKNKVDFSLCKSRGHKIGVGGGGWFVPIFNLAN